MLRFVSAFIVAAVLLAPSSVAAAPFKYPEGKHGKGELKYVNGVPVLTVAGSPEEMGTQIGVLAGKPAAKLVGSLDAFVKQLGLQKALPLLIRAGKQMFKSFPEAHRREAEAFARASGINLDLVVLANTIFDLHDIFGCSVIAVSADKSASGAPLFGRNWDFPPLGNLYEYSLVIVYRPTGKRAFAAVTFPALVASGSAINDAGLVLGANAITRSKDESERNVRGTPLAVAARRLMEECDSVAAGEKLVRAMKPTCMGSLILGDKKTSAVFEVTTKSVQVRRPDRGLCLCTNHFRTKELSVTKRCRRFAALEKAHAQAKLSLADVAKKLHEVNQGEDTLQTMVFEPATLKLHVSLGKGPTSARALKVVELAPLLARR
jgi:hypothetical protein